MFHRYAVAIGAGFAAALLFAVSAETNPLAMALAYLAPLPIMIATMGWGLTAGAVAAVVAALTLSVVAEPTSGALFAASVALPAWLLPAFATTPIARYWKTSGSRTYPSVGAIVVLAAAIGILAAAAVLTGVIVVYHGYNEGAKQVAAALATLAGDAFEDSATAREFAETLVRVGPAAIAGSTLLMLCVNLYVAARSVKVSKSLVRPWEDLPTSLSIPWPLGVALAVFAAGAYFLPAPTSQYFAIGAGGLGIAFVLQGLALAHALSRGLALRPVMLVALYACCILRAKYILPVLAILGVIDAFAKLRTRAAFLPSPKPKPHK